jgi:uncharacterized protein (TIGR03083 family)
MTRLTPEDYLDHIRAESARFRAVLADCDPAARVPGCPDWDAADLLWHLTTVQRFWAGRVADRPAEPTEDEAAHDAERPASYAALLAAFDVADAALLDALEGLDPAEEAWTWSDDHTVGFVLRRQAHEALVHRIDAEQAAAAPSEVDPRLAADGVAEVVGVMYGGCPPWGSWEPLPHHVRLDCTDTGDELWAQLGLFSGTDPRSGDVIVAEEDCHLVAAPADVEPDVVIDGPAAALDAWLGHRGDDADLSVAGDRDVLDRFTAIVAGPIS